VTPDYLPVMGASLRRGRLISPQDKAGQPPVAVVNETIAHRFWPNADPLGARISMNPPSSLIPEHIRRENARRGFSAPPPLTVVGVIGDFRQNGLERETNPEVFVPLAQARSEFASIYFLVVRTVGDPLAATDAIQAVVNQFDPDLPLANVRTMESRLSDSLAQRRFAMLLLSGLAAVALALAVVGLYGVLTYTVNQRRRELGIRAALGATAADAVRLVMLDGLRLTIFGVAIGLPLAGALSQLISSQLFHVNAIDPVVYAVVAVMLVIVAGVACGFPALRATRVDPMSALRCE
jgi:putative ABC transport system permease protein